MPVSKMASRSAIRSMLDAFGLEAKYELGQNFLVDDTVVAHIVELADLAPDDVVLEVGPGCGTLTCALLPRVAAVVAVEADADMQGPLAEVTSDYSERFALVMGDATKVAPAQIAEALAGLRAKNAALAGLPELPSRWVANLPYAVAATLILQYFQEWPFIQDATVMVQSEVADRICAEPRSKIYGAYTVKLQLFAQVVGRFQVPARSFFPEPHVESAVVRLHRLPEGEQLAPADAAFAAQVVDAAFAQRRKTLLNSMAACETWSRAELEAALALMGIDGGTRAETLSKDQFVGLAFALRDGNVPERYRPSASHAARAPKKPKKRAAFDPDLV